MFAAGKYKDRMLMQKRSVTAEGEQNRYGRVPGYWTDRSTFQLTTFHLVFYITANTSV